MSDEATHADENPFTAPELVDLPDLPVGSERKLESFGACLWRKRVFDLAGAKSWLAEAANGFGGRSEQLQSWFEKVSNDKNLGWRDLCQPTPERIGALEDLAASAGHAQRLFDLILPVLRAAAAVDRPIDLPPILLLSPPGMGKTFLSHEIARRLAITPRVISLPNQTNTGVFAGLDPCWRHPGLGEIAKSLITGATASPIFILDEIDKAPGLGDYGDILGPLHDLWEKQTSNAFEDDFLKISFAADRIIWFSTANSLDTLAPSIVDRAFVVELPIPTPTQIEGILVSIYGHLRAGWGDWFEDKLAPAVVRELRACPPRKARKILSFAMTHAAACQRHEITPDDIRYAVELADAGQTRRFGFV